MTEYFVLCIAAFFTSALTLFSGFGLGTLLMPVFALFFSVELAVTLTAVVHLANNLFKLILLGTQANRSVVLRFGLPAIGAAVVGAKTLVWFAQLQPIARYALFGREHLVMPVKLVVAVLMVFFAFFELVPSLEKVSFNKNYLPVGGILSGFFGGFSGNQGAFLGARLMKKVTLRAVQLLVAALLFVIAVSLAAGLI